MEIQGDVLRKMQSLQMEMAIVLLDFCKEHGLSIWAGYGTLLGAVRHQGFIPWDDDMDFVMFREDFDRLRQLSVAETLPFPLAFDSSRVDVIKVRNSNTTQVAISKLSDSENYGIWVDIWCLDSFSKEGISDKDYKRIRSQLRIVSNATHMAYSHSEGVASVLFHTYCLMYTAIVGKHNIFKKIETLIRQTGGGKKGEMLVDILLYSRLKKNTSYSLLKKYELSWFDKTIMLSFNGYDFPCPVDYDKVLTAEYGDYMTPVKGTAVHDTTILNVDRPYKEVIKEYMDCLPWYKRVLHMI